MPTPRNPTPLVSKSTVDEIRTRFDGDVDRFSNVETGQTSTIDASLSMNLITEAAVVSTTPIRRVLDIGCGAGNTTINLRSKMDHDFDVCLLDLSTPMLDRAVERVAKTNAGAIERVASDFRDAQLKVGSFDVILAAAVLHHLRSDEDWRCGFSKIFSLLRPDGSVWIADLVSHESVAIQKLMWQRYGDYLVEIDGVEYRDKVFDYIDFEDSPRSVPYQLELLKSVGFRKVELLHKNSCFAAFGAVR